MESADRLPEEFRLNVPRVDKDWTWVAEENGKIVATVFAGPYHGAVFIGNVFALANHGITLGLLFRRFVKDCRERGHEMYFTFLDDQEACVKLTSILQRANSVTFDRPHILVGGKFEDLAKF